jgi:hypothetical protein
MKCSEVEPMIYLFDELAPIEQTRVQEHLQGCSSCTALFSEIQKVHQDVKRVAGERARTPNAAHLTSRIMAAVSTQQMANDRSPFRLFALDAVLRYSLTALSLMLIITFGIEYISTDSHNSNPAVTLQNAVILDSRMIHSREILERPKSILAACKTPFTDQITYIECIKEQIR